MTDTRVNNKQRHAQLPQAVQSGRILRLVFLAALIAAELALLSVLYTNDFSFVCRDAAPAALCAFLSRAVMRAITFLGVCLIFAFARPKLGRLLLAVQDDNLLSRRWLWLQLVGFGLVLLPWTFAVDGASRPLLLFVFTLWMVGGALAAFGAGFTVATPARWLKVLGELGPIPLAVLALAIFAPEITDLARGVWKIEPLTRVTFQTVVATVDFFGLAATAQPDEHILTTKTFGIGIGSQCSGVEGFALITFFLLCYFYAFAADLRFPNAWLLLPVGLVLSWILNVVRIAALFTIGVRVSPDLAVNGFHSHAGWLMFSLLALSIIAVSRSVPWFRRNHDEIVISRPLREDWTAACIVPFAAFMGASLLLSTLSNTPDLWYVVKVVSMATALGLFLPLYSRIDWQSEPAALAAGAAIGVVWIVASRGGSVLPDWLNIQIALLPGGLLTAWIVLRVVGTIVLVPMVEELFFRGYVLERLDRGGTMMRILALSVSTGLFAAFHDRWVLAGLAGLVYGLFYLRRRQITDAVAAHAASNAVIAAYAVATANWSLI